MAEVQVNDMGSPSPHDGRENHTPQTPLNSLPSNDQPPSKKHKEKIARILAACSDRDFELLAELASSEGGLIDDHTRFRAWPVLLSCDHNQGPWNQDWPSLQRHRDEEQVELDVNRSFVYYPQNESETRMKVRKQELSDVITAVLRQYPTLCYFQGYHDIVQVLLLVLGAEVAGPAAARLSLLRIRDFMLPTLSGAEVHLHLLPAILYAADNQLYRHLSGATSPTPFFALAATLTLYAHDIEEYGDIARVFDFLLASEAVLPVYLFATASLTSNVRSALTNACAQIVMSRKSELLEIDHDEPEMLHSVLSKLPKPLDLEGLIRSTRVLFKRYPPEHLPFRVWRTVSPSSVLKTTRNSRDLAAQTLQDGERFSQKQSAEIQRQDAIKYAKRRVQALAYRYRRPARWTGAAILVAVLAMQFGRTSGSANLNGWLIYAYGTLRQSARHLVTRIW